MKAVTFALFANAFVESWQIFAIAVIPEVIWLDSQLLRPVQVSGSDASLGKIPMQKFKTAEELAYALRPDQPIYGFRPQVLADEAKRFMNLFPGKTAYAVKTNGEPQVLEVLAKNGVSCFDVASPAEFAAVRAVSPKAEMLYMHPVKAQSDIRLALETYGIRVVSLDHEDEITKLSRVVQALDMDPAQITVFVRLATKGQAAYELSKKFGAGPANAVEQPD
jgi:ornithine decarboxylase